MEPGREVSGGLFVACRDTPIMLDGIEDSLDEIFGIERESGINRCTQKSLKTEIVLDHRQSH
jgi:hypothetical protein